jgi:hypothetical protein
MCDNSLHHVNSRPAKIGDRLTTRNFGLGTRGFAPSDEKYLAVCLLPGTELSFAGEVKRESPSCSWDEKIRHKTAIFRQVNQHNPRTHHDALEFPNGEMVLVTSLKPDQQATVLQLPASAGGNAQSTEPMISTEASPMFEEMAT